METKSFLKIVVGPENYLTGPVGYCFRGSGDVGLIPLETRREEAAGLTTLNFVQSRIGYSACQTLEQCEPKSTSQLYLRDIPPAKVIRLVCGNHI
jgi:hypothetical protein